MRLLLIGGKMDNEMRFERVVVHNRKDYDISVKDAFGKEHVLFP